MHTLLRTKRRSFVESSIIFFIDIVFNCYITILCFELPCETAWLTYGIKCMWIWCSYRIISSDLCTFCMKFMRLLQFECVHIGWWCCCYYFSSLFVINALCIHFIYWIIIKERRNTQRFSLTSWMWRITVNALHLKLYAKYSRIVYFFFIFLFSIIKMSPAIDNREVGIRTKFSSEFIRKTNRHREKEWDWDWNWRISDALK